MLLRDEPIHEHLLLLLELARDRLGTLLAPGLLQGVEVGFVGQCLIDLADSYGEV